MVRAPLVPFWFVAFVPANAAWYHRFLKPGWQHVFAFAPLETDRWLMFDVLWTHTEVAIVTGPLMDRMLTRPATQGSILKVQTVPRKVRFRLLPTCVTFVAHLVGDTSGAITPWQLYKSLKRNGAVRAFYRSEANG